MNARIQVEHPVTEAVTGVDLVAEQIAIAGGAGLRLTQATSARDGCAIECRINAEDPAQDFRPSPGHGPRGDAGRRGEGIRVDTHIAAGSRIPPYYDSLHGQDHRACAGPADARWRGCARRSPRPGSTGVHTNLAFQARVLADPEFQAGGVDTGFVARLLERRAT